MRGWVRHLWGALYGILLAPVAVAGLAYGVAAATRGSAGPSISTDDLVGIGVIAVGGLLLGIAVGSRISPLASLVPGLTLATLGALWVVAPAWSLKHLSWPEGILDGSLADRSSWGHAAMGASGALTLLGVLLLVASLPSSRWRSSDRGRGLGDGMSDDEDSILPRI
ncbi:MAG: hypothetical protein P8Z68_06550 [Kineosporiaceae bacterium]|jgi:hypothetical protein